MITLSVQHQSSKLSLSVYHTAPSDSVFRALGTNWLTYLYCKSANTLFLKKNMPPLVCYNFDTHERILIFFLAEMLLDKVSNQKTLYCATTNNVCFCTTWQNVETQKSHFFTQMLYWCTGRIQPAAPWFLQSFWLTTHIHAAVWLPKFCNQCVQLGLLGSMVWEKGSRQSRSSWTVLHA